MNDGVADILCIQFFVDLWCTYSEIPIDKIASYCDTRQEFLQTVQYKFYVDDNAYRVDLHRDPDGKITVTTATATPSRTG
jgi:hypothetical protein